MRKKIYQELLIGVILVGLIAFMATDVPAGSKELVATKKTAYEDDKVESMRDVFKRREEEEKVYRQKILADNEESIKLLKEIRDLLQQLNEKE